VAKELDTDAGRKSAVKREPIADAKSFRCVRGVGRFFQAKAKNCKLASRRNYYLNAESQCSIATAVPS